MKICNIINAKGKTVRLREDAEELTIDADGRYFAVPLAGEGNLVSVSVAENMILVVTEKEGVVAYSYAGQVLFSLNALVGEPLPKVLSATVMNPPEVLGFLSRVENAPLIRETVHFFCACEGGKMFLVDLSDGSLVYSK